MSEFQQSQQSQQCEEWIAECKNNSSRPQIPVSFEMLVKRCENVVEYVLKHGIAFDFNAQEDYPYDVLGDGLMILIEMGKTKLAEELIKSKRINLTNSNYNGKTALIFALEKNNFKIFNLILQTLKKNGACPKNCVDFPSS